MKEKIGQAVRDFILENVEYFPKTISQETIKRFNITRQAVNRHLKLLEKQGMIASRGVTRNKNYFLKLLITKTFNIPLSPHLAEDQIWREKIDPLMQDFDNNVVHICHYGFTEMFNNVMEHAHATMGSIRFSVDAKKIRMIVSDNGVGIFNKIAKEKQLTDVRHAILELAKGKLTTDPKAHTGEGIFFTSRMFDHFSILSGALFFSCSVDGKWLWEDKDKSVQGTVVSLEIGRHTERTPKKVFDEYASEDDFGFTRTRFPVGLAAYGDENLISRSQAKRLLNGLERFHEVILDFEGVQTIGQAFADEIFRVYSKEHPQILLSWVRANDDIEAMIRHVKSLTE